MGQNRPTLRVLFATKYTGLKKRTPAPVLAMLTNMNYVTMTLVIMMFMTETSITMTKMEDLIMLSRVSNSSGMLMYFTITKPGSPELG